LYAAAGAGLVAMPSPGSIFAYAAMSPRGGFVTVLGGVAAATVMSFGVAVLLLKTAPARAIVFAQRRDIASSTAYVSMA
jgi:mannitol-specific phosphotransferase system IIBC component